MNVIKRNREKDMRKRILCLLFLVTISIQPVYAPETSSASNTLLPIEVSVSVCVPCDVKPISPVVLHDGFGIATDCIETVSAKTYTSPALKTECMELPGNTQHGSLPHLPSVLYYIHDVTASVSDTHPFSSIPIRTAGHSRSRSSETGRCGCGCASLSPVKGVLHYGTPSRTICQRIFLNPSSPS